MNKYLIRKIFLYSVLILFCAILQLNYPRSLEFKGLVPDFLLVLTIVTAYFNGMDDGIIIGIISGLTKNMFSGRSLGLGILILMYAAIISSVLLRNHLKTGVPACLLQTILISALYFILTGFVSYMTGDTIFSFRDYSAWWFTNRILPGTILNILTSLVLMLPVKISASRIFKSEDENKLVRAMEIM